VHPLQWLSQRDPDLAALRRSGRTAIVMPALFALGDKVIANPALATFAAFGSFAMLLLVDFNGSLRERLPDQALLVLTGGIFVCLGTLVSQNVALSTVTMAVVGFAVIFAGVISSVIASATTALLLSFILPVTITAPISSLPDRLAGWGMAGGASLLAVALLWPTPQRGPLRAAATAACAAIASRLRADVAYMLSDRGARFAGDREQAIKRADDASAALHRVFLATPYRPASLSTAGRTVVRLVEELSWLSVIVARSAQPTPTTTVNRAACAVKIAAAGVLERGSQLLATTGGDRSDLHSATSELRDALSSLEEGATAYLPAGRAQTAPNVADAGAVNADAEAGAANVDADAEAAGDAAGGGTTSELITALDPSFRAQELGFAVTSIAENVDLAAAAERRTWLQRLLGQRPQGLVGTFTAAQQRAAAHVDRNSVWLHNSVRGAAGLALAVLVANETGVQHSFWVVLGALSVLRSNALNTGQNVVRGLLGTVAGFAIGGALLQLVGADQTALWVLLPLAILLAGFAPAAISFAAGQAGFTLTLVFLYNIIQPAGWRVGLVRVEDIALGCGVSLVVGLLFWPRGARAALRRALADAYSDSAGYLASAVDFGMRRCDFEAAAVAAPTEDAERAAAATRRLDDTFRSYLAERGAKPMPLSEVTSLVSGVGGLRLAGDAVLDLWQREDGSAAGDRAAARQQIVQASEVVKRWYDDLAASLLAGHEPREPLAHDEVADGRLVDAVRRDLRDANGDPTATAVRMIWTGDHLDAARRLQGIISEPARAASRS
jgi:hypothetical protein